MNKIQRDKVLLKLLDVCVLTMFVPVSPENTTLQSPE